MFAPPISSPSANTAYDDDSILASVESEILMHLIHVIFTSHF
jgi:hypothetical protein